MTHNPNNKECPITDLWPSETNVCDCPPATEGEKHWDENDNCLDCKKPMRDHWQGCPSPVADTERWEESFKKLLECKWQYDKPIDYLLDEQGIAEVTDFIRSLLVHSAEEKGKKHDHSDCDECYERAKNWENIGIETAKTMEQEWRKESVSQREDEILRDMRREVVDEFEELMLSFHATEKHGQQVTQTWTNIITRLTAIIKKRTI